MARSLFVLALLSSVAFAQSSVTNLDSLPPLSNDLTSYDTSAFLSSSPTGTLEPYPGSNGSPYPAGASSGTYQSPPPAPTETGGPVYNGGGPTAAPTTVATTYSAPPAANTTVASNSTVASNTTVAANTTVVANTTVAPYPTPSSIQSSGNAFVVKLPVVLGALGLVFAML